MFAAAIPRIAGTFLKFYFTILLLKMLYCPLAQAVVKTQKPQGGCSPACDLPSHVASAVSFSTQHKVLWASVGEEMHCHDLLANLQKKINTMCLAGLLEGCKNPHTNEVVAENQKAFQVTFE